MTTTNATAGTVTADDTSKQIWIAPGEQGFLVGETLYLRPPEDGDAGYALAWHASPYPIIRRRAEQIIKEQFVKEANQQRLARLIACRRSDDIPVGTITYSARERHSAYVKLFANPPLGQSAGAVKAEMLGILVPWLLNETQRMVIRVELDAPEPEVLAGAAAVGMRPAVRLREAIWRDGARHDRWLYELLNPRWVERLGDPGAGIEHATEPPATVPTSRRVSIKHPTGPVPANALLVGERVALRLTEPDDGKEISRLLRYETEPAWNGGRWLAAPRELGAWVEESQEQTPPSEYSLAVILRQTGALIGTVELFDLDMFNRIAETGSEIYLPEYRGQGLGTEAKNLLLEFAFDRLGLHVITSDVWGYNPRSRAALLKQGYRDAGRVNWAQQTDDGYAYMMLFDLLASEWRQRVDAAPA